MHYSVSTCSFVKLKVKRLLNLPIDMGVEIFYEYGSIDYWRNFLTRFRSTHTGSFSIHSPFAFNDFSVPCDEKSLFELFRKPFDLYNQFNGEFYVLHAFNNIDNETGLHHAEEYRKRTIERIARFDDICSAEGVCLAVENTWGNPHNLFTQEQWMDMFKQLPDLHALIDTGHALVSGMDIFMLQKALNNRIVGYHLHNNDGLDDLHWRLKHGIMDWESFARNAKLYSPRATGVIEYLTYDDTEGCIEDIEYLNSLIKS